MNVRPTSCWMSFSSICICWRSLRSSAPSGSSSSSTRGRMTSARASATRCRCPPESCPGLRSPYSPSRTISSASATRAVRSAFEHLADHQSVGDVLGHRHVREQGVVLEDRVHVALVRRQTRDIGPAEQDPALGRLLEPGDHAQAGGLARARRTQHREELPFANLEVDPVDGDDVAEALDHVLEAHGDPVHGRRAVRHRHGSIGQAVFPLMLVGAPNPERSQY